MCLVHDTREDAKSNNLDKVSLKTLASFLMETDKRLARDEHCGCSMAIVETSPPSTIGSCFYLCIDESPDVIIQCLTTFSQSAS